mmetsp:Transcript_8341/g.26437  ORF Transcript_8341/g.26437 Transcript_8341/m.26437 type:complete len:92 (+) Transcript_8341:1232-1507(+)
MDGPAKANRFDREERCCCSRNSGKDEVGAMRCTLEGRTRADASGSLRTSQMSKALPPHSPFVRVSGAVEMQTNCFYDLNTFLHLTNYFIDE